MLLSVGFFFFFHLCYTANVSLLILFSLSLFCFWIIPVVICFETLFLCLLWFLVLFLVDGLRPLTEGILLFLLYLFPCLILGS